MKDAEDDDGPILIPEGAYNGKIVAIHPPRPLKSKVGLRYVQFVVEIPLGRVFVTYVGYVDMANLIYKSRDCWLGQHVLVKCKHKVHRDQILLDTHIIYD